MLIFWGVVVLAFCNQDKNSRHAPLVREPFIAVADDPNASNDESNDQPIGHFGTLTLLVTSDESGNTYTLDVELDGLEVSRIYFPKGGHVDFYGCELEDDYTGWCLDEQGRGWIFD